MLYVIDDGSMVGICPSRMQGLVCGRKSGYIPWRINIVSGRNAVVLTTALQSYLHSLSPGVLYHAGSNLGQTPPAYGPEAPFVG